MSRRVFDRQSNVFINDVERELMPLIFEEIVLEEFEEARAQNERALGYRPPETLRTDNVENRRPREVNPAGGYSEIAFDVTESVVPFVVAAFERIAPIGRTPKPPGARYRDSLIVMEGARVLAPPYVRQDGEATLRFGAITPYSRKIERGLSKQRSNGVFEHMLVPIVRREFERTYRIWFEFANWGIVAGGRFYKPGGHGRSSAPRDPSSLGRSDRAALSRYPTLVMEPD